MITTKTTGHLAILATVLLLGIGCGSMQENAAVSVDQDSVVVKVFEPLVADCISNSERAGRDGGRRQAFAVRAAISFSPSLVLEGRDGGRRFLSGSQCEGYVVNVSGNAEGEGSLLVDVNGIAVSVTLDENGYFEVNVPMSRVDASDLRIDITPMN